MLFVTVQAGRNFQDSIISDYFKTFIQICLFILNNGIVHYMKRIVIYNRASSIVWTFLLLIAGIIAFIYVDLFYLKLFEIIILVVVFLFILCSKGTYISDIIIYDEYIELIYRKNNQLFGIYKKERILKSNIESFDVELIKEELNLYRMHYSYFVTVNIKETNENEIEFKIDSLNGNPYYNFLDFVTNRALIPNFSYKTNGIHKVEKEEIDFILKNGKRKINTLFLVILIIILLTFLSFMLFLLFLCIGK